MDLDELFTGSNKTPIVLLQDAKGIDHRAYHGDIVEVVSGGCLVGERGRVMFLADGTHIGVLFPYKEIKDKALYPYRPGLTHLSNFFAPESLRFVESQSCASYFDETIKEDMG